MKENGKSCYRLSRDRQGKDWYGPVYDHEDLINGMGYVVFTGGLWWAKMADVSTVLWKPSSFN